MHLLEQAAVFLLTAVLLVPLFQRLRLGAVLGYLAAGMLIGPWGLRLVGEVGATMEIAEFGVVLLLFFFVSLIEPAVQAWLRRDLAGIAAVQLRVGAQFPDMAAHYRLLDRHLVHNRSVVMAHRLFWPLREVRSFIAVGARHLQGAQGMLALVAAQGWSPERVY